MEAKFSVKTESFEGPLDLLLDLIEKRKLHINDVSLAKVADDFIAHIRQFEQFPIDQSAHFILIASTLLLIKSKSLLPSLALTEEEQGNISDLEERLKIYKRIKELGEHVKSRFGKEIIFAKQSNRIQTPVFSPDKNTNVPSLFAAVKAALANLPKKEFLPKVLVKKVISLEEMIENLTERVKRSLKMSFKEFAKVGKEEKITVIVSFLAMLELVKQGVIMVHQESKFSDIHMETENISVPQYN